MNSRLDLDRLLAERENLLALPPAESPAEQMRRYQRLSSIGLMAHLLRKVAEDGEPSQKG